MPVEGLEISSAGGALAHRAGALASIPRTVQNQTGAAPNPNSLLHAAFCFNLQNKKPKDIT